VVKIPGDQADEGIDGNGGKDSGRREVLRSKWKTPIMSTTGQGSDGEQL